MESSIQATMFASIRDGAFPTIIGALKDYGQALRNDSSTIAAGYSRDFGALETELVQHRDQYLRHQQLLIQIDQRQRQDQITDRTGIDMPGRDKIITLLEAYRASGGNCKAYSLALRKVHATLARLGLGIPKVKQADIILQAGTVLTILQHPGIGLQDQPLIHLGHLTSELGALAWEALRPYIWDNEMAVDDRHSPSMSTDERLKLQQDLPPQTKAPPPPPPILPLLTSVVGAGSRDAGKILQDNIRPPPPPPPPPPTVRWSSTPVESMGKTVITQNSKQTKNSSSKSKPWLLSTAQDSSSGTGPSQAWFTEEARIQQYLEYWRDYRLALGSFCTALFESVNCNCNERHSAYLRLPSEPVAVEKRHKNAHLPSFIAILNMESQKRKDRRMRVRWEVSRASDGEGTKEVDELRKAEGTCVQVQPILRLFHIYREVEVIESPLYWLDPRENAVDAFIIKETLPYVGMPPGSTYISLKNMLEERSHMSCFDGEFSELVKTDLVLSLTHAHVCLHHSSYMGSEWSTGDLLFQQRDYNILTEHLREPYMVLHYPTRLIASSRRSSTVSLGAGRKTCSHYHLGLAILEIITGKSIASLGDPEELIKDKVRVGSTSYNPLHLSQLWMDIVRSCLYHDCKGPNEFERDSFLRRIMTDIVLPLEKEKAKRAKFNTTADFHVIAEDSVTPLLRSEGSP